MTSDLEANLGHEFSKPHLMVQALTHSSYASEHPGTEYNERFEFLGDAVLQLAVTDFLFSQYPALPEGQLAKIRAASVSGAALTEMAERVGLGAHLRLGRGEEASGGREKESILADAMEAVLAAVHLDADYPTARSVILSLWEDHLRAWAEAPGRRDYKTRLQEKLAADGERPEYVVEGSGPDHARLFTARVHLGDKILGAGEGRSKKEAEQEAARLALDNLES